MRWTSFNCMSPLSQGKQCKGSEEHFPPSVVILPGTRLQSQESLLSVHFLEHLALDLLPSLKNSTLGEVRLIAGTDVDQLLVRIIKTESLHGFSFPYISVSRFKQNGTQHKPENSAVWPESWGRPSWAAPGTQPWFQPLLSFRFSSPAAPGHSCICPLHLPLCWVRSEFLPHVLGWHLSLI